jgi:hypothetical protein
MGRGFAAISLDFEKALSAGTGKKWPLVRAGAGTFSHDAMGGFLKDLPSRWRLQALVLKELHST